MSYIWSSSCSTDDQLVDPSIIAVRPNLPILIIREDMMAGRSTCGFTLTVTDEETGRVGSDSVDVTLDTPPDGGSITVTPSAGGIALETLFHLEANGWTDPHEPLYYQFLYTPAGSTFEIALTQLMPASYADVYLPAGDIEVARPARRRARRPGLRCHGAGRPA